MFKNHLLTSAFSTLLAMSGSALAAEAPAAPTDIAGFYGGIALRAAGRDGQGLSLGQLGSTWSRFALPMADDSGSRTLAYGGYRFGNDLVVETVATFDRYSLQPALTASRRGVGLALASENEPAAKTLNVDVYTSWEFRKSFSLYGRLGYAQTETQSAYTPGFASDVVRRNRDGVNYGLGLRYDMTPALGLRVEYARFGRLPGELASGLMPENDQVQLGVQFRF